MNDSSSPTEPLVAIDARLASGTSTGDSTYWTGLLYGLAEIAPHGRFLLLSNADRPVGIPAGPFIWQKVPARSGRWWSLIAFPLAARRLRASVLHTQYTLTPLAGRRGVTTVHDVSFLIEPSWFPRKDALLLSRTVPASIRRSAATLTVSETSRKDIERLVPGSAGKIMVTPNACPPWIESMEPATARARLHELGITDPYVLTVSTRWPRKNMELAVEAMARLPEEIPHRLILTGKGGWGEGAAGRRGKAVGYVDHATLSALYAGADLYLCPSRHEGFGIPLLEAFRARCPVLCSAGGALPEVSGDAAAIEPSWEPQAWADRIASLLNDPGTLDLMRRRGVAREMEFTWAETARRTLEVYRRVARA